MEAMQIFQAMPHPFELNLKLATHMVFQLKTEVMQVSQVMLK